MSYSGRPSDIGVGEKFRGATLGTLEPGGITGGQRLGRLIERMRLLAS